MQVEAGHRLELLFLFGIEDVVGVVLWRHLLVLESVLLKVTRYVLATQSLDVHLFEDSRRNSSGSQLLYGVLEERDEFWSPFQAVLASSLQLEVLLLFLVALHLVLFVFLVLFGLALLLFRRHCRVDASGRSRFTSRRRHWRLIVAKQRYRGAIIAVIKAVLARAGGRLRCQWQVCERQLRKRSDAQRRRAGAQVLFLFLETGADRCRYDLERSRVGLNVG